MLIRHVILGIGRWFAILADIGPEEGKVAAVARVFIVIYVATVTANTLGWRINQAHIANNQLFDQVVFKSIMELRTEQR